MVLVCDQQNPTGELTQFDDLPEQTLRIDDSIAFGNTGVHTLVNNDLQCVDGGDNADDFRGQHLRRQS